MKGAKTMKANTYIREVEPKFKRSEFSKKVQIKSSKDAYKLFNDMEDNLQEKMIALHLAGDNSVVCFQVVHIGSINSAFCNPADILRTTLLTGAVGLVVIHNHPSGNPLPSPSDKEAIDNIKKACNIFQLQLFDSIIIGKDKYYSAADAGDLLRKEQIN